MNKYIVLQRVRQKRQRVTHQAGKPQKKPPQVLPTPVIKTICSEVGRLGCMSEDQLYRIFGARLSKESFKDRMREIENSGYLASKVIDARGRPERVYHLHRGTKLRELFKPDELKALQVKMPASSELRSVLRTHDILLKVQEKFSITSFVTEHQLKSMKSLSGCYKTAPIVSDGRLTFGKGNSGSAGVTLEVEVDGAYNGKKLKNKISSMASSGKMTVWVTYSQTRLDRLAGLCAGTCITPVLFDSLNNFLDTLC